MKTVVEKPNTGKLSEITQQNKTELALCRYDAQKDKVIQCHQFVHCRDFMHDVLIGAEDNREMQVYGFTYSTDDPRPDPENASILLRFPDGSYLKNFQDNFSILKGIEEFLQWGSSYAEIVDYPGERPVVWVVSDVRWQSTAISFSLWTYILKCLSYKIVNKSKWREEIAVMTYEENYGGSLNFGTTLPVVEAKYMDLDYINKLLASLDDVCSKYKTYSGFRNQKVENIMHLHNDSGFVKCKPLVLGTLPKTSLKIEYGPEGYKRTDGPYNGIYVNHDLFGYQLPK